MIYLASAIIVDTRTASGCISRTTSFFPGGGALNLFSGRGVQPGFPKYGACELTIASEKGACERKIFKFGAL